MEINAYTEVPSGVAFEIVADLDKPKKSPPAELSTPTAKSNIDYETKQLHAERRRSSNLNSKLTPVRKDEERRIEAKKTVQELDEKFREATRLELEVKLKQAEENKENHLNSVLVKCYKKCEMQNEAQKTAQELDIKFREAAKREIEVKQKTAEELKEMQRINLLKKCHEHDAKIEKTKQRAKELKENCV